MTRVPKRRELFQVTERKTLLEIHSTIVVFSFLFPIIGAKVFGHMLNVI